MGAATSAGRQDEIEEEETAKLTAKVRIALQIAYNVINLNLWVHLTIVL